MLDDSTLGPAFPARSDEELAAVRQRTAEIEQRLYAIWAELEDCSRRIDNADTAADVEAIMVEASRLADESAQLRIEAATQADRLAKDAKARLKKLADDFGFDLATG
jgi:hypothetical protein